MAVWRAMEEGVQKEGFEAFHEEKLQYKLDEL